MNSKLSSFLKGMLFTLLWCGIVGYLIFSQIMVSRRTAQVPLKSIEISVVDSTARGNLISSKVVESWITRSGIKTIGQRADSLELRRIKETIESHRYIQSASLYTTYSGKLLIEVDGRTAALRFMVDGYNKYITPTGYVFDVPQGSSLYVPVVTGDYTPLFPRSYEGSIDDYLKQQQAKVAERIEKIEREDIYPLLAKERENKENERLRRKMFIKQTFGESDEAFEERVQKLRAKKEMLRKQYISIGNDLKAQIERVKLRQEVERRAEKKLIKNCDDLHNLINFAKRLDNDSFWHAEVVQIIADEGSNGQIRVGFIPRSGSFKVTLGTLNGEDDADEKLDKLFDFYHTALSRVGWDRYKSINVEYKNQVVCK